MAKGEDVYQVRRQNLVLLVGTGSWAEFARRVDTDPNHLYTVKNGHRNLGMELARRIEKVVGKPRGWMDHQHIDEVTEQITAEINALPADKKRVVLEMIRALKK